MHPSPPFGPSGTPLLKSPDEESLVCVPPPPLEDPVACPPLRNHLPIDVVAHKTISFTHGLSMMPMINSHLVSPTPTVPPQSLMDNTYSALKKRVREALLAEWPSLLPTPGYYHHLHALNP